MKYFLSRFGKAIGLIAGIPLALFGGSVTGLLLLVIGLAHLSAGWLVLVAFLLILFGLLPLSLGVAAIYASQYASAKIAREAIRDRFYQLLRRGDGRISLLGFSDATRLEPAIARQYLDGWARECDATFDVTDEGDIYYVFATPPQSLPAGETAPFQPLRSVVAILQKLA
jgi:hypothetical protein